MKTLLFLLALACAFPAFGKGVAMATLGPSVTVTLKDDACNLPFLIDALQLEWKSNGKTYHGCWSLNGLGIVLTWTDDKRMAGIPQSEFKMLEGI